MPVSRCHVCFRGLSGYLDSEKELFDLTPGEVRTEIGQYEAKETRIRTYMNRLRNGEVTPQAYAEGTSCPGCGHGWREFENHRKDLEQLTATQAKSALANNSRWLKDLRQRAGVLT